MTTFLPVTVESLMKGEPRYYIFDERLPARRIGTNFPEVYGGTVEGGWQTYEDIERFSLNTEQVTKGEVDALVKKLGKGNGKVEKHNPYHDILGKFSTGTGAKYVSLWGKPYAAKVHVEQEKQRLQSIANEPVKPKITHHIVLPPKLGVGEAVGDKDLAATLDKAKQVLADTNKLLGKDPESSAPPLGVTLVNGGANIKLFGQDLWDASAKQLNEHMDSFRKLSAPAQHSLALGLIDAQEKSTGSQHFEYPAAVQDWIDTVIPPKPEGLWPSYKPGSAQGETAAEHYALNKTRSPQEAAIAATNAWKKAPKPKPAKGVKPVQLAFWDEPPHHDVVFHNLMDEGHFASPSATEEGKQRFGEFKKVQGEAVDALSDKETAAIQNYTGTWHTSINKAYGNGTEKNLSTQQKGTVKNLDKALSKTTLGQDMVLVRAIPTIHLMNAFGITGHDEMTKENLVGRVYGEKGFASTTLRTDDAISGVTSAQILKGSTILHINAPKDTHGLYVQSISSHTSEQEVLLPRGMQYVITDFKKDSGYNNPRYHLTVDLINGQE